MPAYAQQIPEKDRWAIVSYIRALQVGQNPNALNAKAEPTPDAEEKVEDAPEKGTGN